MFGNCLASLELVCPRNNQTLLNGPVTLRRQDAEMDDTVVLNCVVFIVVKCALFYTTTQINLHTLVITSIYMYLHTYTHTNMWVCGFLRTHSGELAVTSSLLLLYQSVPVSARQWVPMSATNFKYIYFSCDLLVATTLPPLLQLSYAHAHNLTAKRHLCGQMHSYYSLSWLSLWLLLLAVWHSDCMIFIFSRCVIVAFVVALPFSLLLWLFFTFRLPTAREEHEEDVLHTYMHTYTYSH